MAENISNRTLAILLVVAIIFSLGGLVVSLTKISSVRAPIITGRATDTDIGTASIVISSTSSIVFKINSIAFGTGAVNTTNNNQICTMNTAAGGGYKDAITNCVNFNSATGFLPLVLENDGNTNMSVNITTTHNATDLLGSGTPAPALRFKVTNNETNSCASPNPSAWQSFNKTSMGICLSAGGIGYSDTIDTLNIDINITIPYNNNITDKGQYNVTLTATGTSM